MKSNASNRFVKAISLIVTLAGFAVMAGWMFDIGVLKSVSPAWVSMKFTTALAFVLSGVSLYFIVRASEGEFDKAQVVLFITSMIIVLLMGTLFLSALLKIRMGLEDLFIKEAAGTVKTVAPGRPSLPTMLNFILIASAGILTMVNAKNLRFKLRTIGLVVGLIGTFAVAGYIIGAPVLYYYIEGINSAIALHTAGLFMLWGIGLLCL
jgi:hypothetical protein